MARTKSSALKLLVGVAAAGLMYSVTVASASTIIGTEDASGGFVGNFLESMFPGTSYLVASDGETSFDPFGAGYDTSDGVNFSGVAFEWNQASDSFWNNIGFQTWVLPADLTTFGCGTENEPKCEPVGHFISPSAWNSGAIGVWDILSADGALSDRIITYNDDNGVAHLKFYSDPISEVPVPAALPLLASGLSGLGVAGWRRNRSTKIAASC